MHFGRRARLHADMSNKGPSMVMVTGPGEAGWLWQYKGLGEACQVFGKDAWVLTDGNLPHLVMPFAGERVSIVVFTHAAADDPKAKHLEEECEMLGFKTPKLGEGNPYVARKTQQITLTRPNRRIKGCVKRRSDL